MDVQKLRSHPRPLIGAAAVMVAGTLAVVIAAREPSTTNAAPVIRADVPDRQVEDARVLGELVGAKYRVRAVTSNDGPRYDVLTLEGTLLKEGLYADEVYKHFPSLEITELHFGPDAETWSTGALMLADPPTDMP